MGSATLAYHESIEKEDKIEKGVSKMNHFIIKCSCDNVISQCSCPVKWEDRAAGKPVTVIERGCQSCHNSTALVERLSNDIWQISVEGNSVLINKADWQYINSIIHDHYHGED